MDTFLSAFQIECSSQEDEYKGFLTPVAAAPRTDRPASMREHKNGRQRFYEENFLEEWVARSPESIFPQSFVQVIASQNYCHLPKKIDLLFAGCEGGFFVVEVKIDRVSQDGPETPWQIQHQMHRYVDFLDTYLADYPKSFAGDYARFATRFFGSPRTLPTVSQGIIDSGDFLTRVYLTAGYDPYSVNFLANEGAKRHYKVRLVYYRFFPIRPHHVIEFWEVNAENRRGAERKKNARQPPKYEPIVRGDLEETHSHGDTVMLSETNEDDFDIGEIIGGDNEPAGAEERKPCFLIGKKKHTKRVQYICSVHLFQGRAIHTFGLLDASYKRTGSPDEKTIDGIRRCGYKIDPPGFNVKNMAAWVQYGKKKAKELGLTVEHEA